jgi:hypothetical protein
MPPPVRAAWLKREVEEDEEEGGTNYKKEIRP